MNRTTTRLTAVLGTVGVAAALLAPLDAQAWRHTRQVWLPQDLPFEWFVGPGDEETLPEGYTIEALERSYDAWRDAECADLGSTYGGRLEVETGFQFDRIRTHTFNDPRDELEAGVLGATLTRPGIGAGQVAFVFEGQTYHRAEDSDIVYSKTVAWTTDEAITAGNCANEYSMISVATHEIGHSFGLGHSCEKDEICVEPALREATMYWSIGPCQTHASVIGTDDIEALTLLYGPSTTFKCSNELDPTSRDTIAVGNVPFELKCSLVTEYGAEIDNVTWYWGDGTVDDGAAMDQAHAYDKAGNYTVRACIEGQNDVCGDWDFCFRREGYVRACDVPAPEFRVTHKEGRTYQFLNETDLSVYGCINEVQWDVFEGSTLVTSISAWEPVFTFPGDGEYRVVLNVGGPAGAGAADSTFAVRNRGSSTGSCSTLPAGGALPAGALGLGLLGLLGLRRRRG